MATKKSGFIYYSVDTNRYQDMRIKRLRKDFGCNGVAIYDYILCEIYRVEGCSIVWDENTAFDVSDYWGLKESLINEVVSYCCHVGLFNKELRESESILSSKAILQRFIDWSKKAKREYQIPEELAFILEESVVFPEESAKIPEVLPEVKERKGKESKEVIIGVPPKQKTNVDEIVKSKKKEFWKSINTPENIEKYGEPMLIEFSKYWCETSVKDHSKFRHESEKFFDTMRRLATWFKNQKPEYQPEKQTDQPPVPNFKIK